jgi:dolichol-phosphate mannosyltransferase
LDGGDFRLVDRKILNQLKELHDASPYVRGLISMLASNIVGIPYARTIRKFGKSKFPVSKLFLLAVDGIVSHSVLPLRLASLFGALVFAVTTFLGLWYAIDRLWIGSSIWPRGFATTVILQLVSISLNAMFLGVVGEYLGRIYNQIRIRPTTVIEAALNID